MSEALDGHAARGTYSYEHLVTFEDTHLMGGVYFANYLRWQGLCREHFLAEHASGVVAQVRSGELVLATVSCGCEYLAELHAMDRVEVQMSMTALYASRIEMRFDYLQPASDSRPAELVARGHHVAACLRRQGDQLEPVPVPDELADAIRAISAG